MGLFPPTTHPASGWCPHQWIDDSVSMAGCSGVYWVTPGAFLVGPIIVGLQTKILIYTLPNVKKKTKNKLQTVHCLYRSINYFFWLFSNYLFEFVWIYLMNFTFMLEVSSCFRRILKKNHQATGSLAKPHVSTCEVNTLKIRNSSSVQFYCIFTQYSTTMVQYTNKMLCPN